MKKLLCRLGLHSFNEHLTVRVKAGDYWLPLERYKICGRCKKSVRTF